MKSKKTLIELFSFDGFRARSSLTGKFGEPNARIITLMRRKKRRFAQAVVQPHVRTMTKSGVSHAMLIRQSIAFIFGMKNVVFSVLGAKACG